MGFGIRVKIDTNGGERLLHSTTIVAYDGKEWLLTNCYFTRNYNKIQVRIPSEIAESLVEVGGLKVLSSAKKALLIRYQDCIFYQVDLSAIWLARPNGVSFKGEFTRYRSSEHIGRISGWIPETYRGTNREGREYLKELKAKGIEVDETES